MLRWLTRLFRQRDESATVPAAAPAPSIEPPAAPPETAQATTVGPAIAVASTSTDGEIVTVADADPDEPVTVDAAALSIDGEAKETCPTCGRTSVFAGPPGQRFCTYCALRDELFEHSAAASSPE